jgi:hypothetical protein
MVLMRDRRAEECEDTIPGRLRYVAAVMMDRVHHQLERGIDQAARLLRVEILDQLHRALDLGEQGRHRLALAFGNFRSFGRDADPARRRGRLSCRC